MTDTVLLNGYFFKMFTNFKEITPKTFYIRARGIYIYITPP